jgi:hypothetical protein
MTEGVDPSYAIRESRFKNLELAQCLAEAENESWHALDAGERDRYLRLADAAARFRWLRLAA